MHMDIYEQLASETAVYPYANTGSYDAINYCILGLNGEAGELANKLKKIARDNMGVLTDQTRFDLAKELGDCQWYLARIAAELGFSLEAIATHNIEKLASRKERGVLGGAGDDR